MPVGQAVIPQDTFTVWPGRTSALPGWTLSELFAGRTQWKGLRVGRAEPARQGVTSAYSLGCCWVASCNSRSRSGWCLVRYCRTFLFASMLARYLMLMLSVSVSLA